MKGEFFFEDWDIKNRKLAKKLGYKNFKHKQIKKQSKTKGKVLA
jgi:hypothetical protein